LLVAMRGWNRSSKRRAIFHPTQSKVPLLTAREPDTRYEISDSLDFLHLFISEVRSQAYAQPSLKMKKGGLMAALCVDM
jgi:hypothetical protein